LTETQKDGLIYLIEEEKLEKDAYTTLYDKWNNRIFSNIVKSEIKKSLELKERVVMMTLSFKS